MAQYLTPPAGSVPIYAEEPDGRTRFAGYRIPGDPIIHLRNHNKGRFEVCHARDLVGEDNWRLVEKIRDLQKRTGWTAAEVERFLASGLETAADVGAHVTVAELLDETS